MPGSITTLKQKLFLEITDTPDVLNQSHFPSLDGLRGLSIIMVVIFHIILSYKFAYNFHSLATLGVQFFFVMSGFLITTLLIKEKLNTGRISYKNFYIRRFFRIIPAAYLYLIVITLLNYILNLGMNFFALLTSFLFVRNFFLYYGGVNHLTGHWWSLSVEEQFYLIFPFILKKSINIYFSFLLFIIVASCLISISEFLALTVHNPYVLFSIQLITQFQGIAVGSVFSILLFKGVIPIEKKIEHKNLVIALLFLAIIGLTFIEVYSTNIVILMECILFAIILLMNLKESSAGDYFYRFLNNKKMKLTGALSYSLYIWQQPFTLGLSHIHSRFLLNKFKSNLLYDLLITGVSFLILTLISYFSYYFYEKKFLKLKDNYKISF